MADLKLVVDDTAPSVFGALAVDGVAVNLASASEVRFQMRSKFDRRLSLDRTAVVVSESLGEVRYDWQEGDLGTPGEYASRWEIVWGDGTRQHTEPENTITIGSI